MAAAIAAAALALVAAPAAEAAKLVPVGAFALPIYATAPPGEETRLYVVERGGTVRVVENGVTLPEPFLTYPEELSQTGEGGLLSIAFPPAHAASGLLYTYSTPAPHVIRIDEFRRLPGDPPRADPASRRTVIEIAHPQFTNHYGGQIQFGPDGFLYAAPGDGGSAGDPANRAQNLGDLLGKLLRIDPRQAGSAPYTVPADNPFTGVAGARPEIFAYGLRNPFRFSFDRETGDLTIGDVGQDALEEIDFVPRADGGGRGANFGWSVFEGTRRFKQGDAPGHVPPVHEYANGGFTVAPCAITGGYVVRDPGLAELAGRYVYGDLCSGELRSIELDTPSAHDDRSLGLVVPALVSFAEDAAGCVYAISIGGTVFRLAPDAGVDPPTAPLPCLAALRDATG